tara:strand:+ start:266 stop:838 length:573 start_codon:yes stop_codon:yes gene_type:complete
MLTNFNKILDIFINDLIPLTNISINKGNKIFGAFIVKKLDLSLISIGTNEENKNPLFHGEISTLFNFYEKNFNNTKDYYFISSHQPCSLCLSAITWSGFDNFYYFFPYHETNENFNIPHDLKILEEVFKIKDGDYKKNNHYWDSFSIISEIRKLEVENQLSGKINKIKEEYQKMSKIYQENKKNNKIPLN